MGVQHVAKPYEIAVPRAVPVAQPYKVHPVQQVVETPIIHKKTVTVQQPVVHTAVQQSVQTYAAPAAAGVVGYNGAAIGAGYGLAAAAPAAAGVVGINGAAIGAGYGLAAAAPAGAIAAAPLAAGYGLAAAAPAVAGHGLWAADK